MSNFEKNAKEFLQKIGVKPDKFEGETVDVDALAQSFKADFKSVELSDDIDNARRAGMTAAMKKVEKQLIQQFGLDADKYKDLTSGQLEAILKDATEAAKSQTANTAQESAEIAKMLDTANKKLKEYEAQLATLPDQIEAAKKEGIFTAKKEASFEMQIERALHGVKPEYHNLLKSAVKGGGLTVELKNDKVIIAQITPEGVKPLQKSPTEYYENLQEVLISQGIISEAMKATTATQTTNTAPATPQTPNTQIGNSKFMQTYGDKVPVK